MDFEIGSNFHDSVMRDGLKDIPLDQLQAMLEKCVKEEDFELARVIKLEIDSRRI